VEQTQILTDAIKAEIAHHIHEEEHRQSACAEALRIVQNHYGWIDDNALAAVAEFLDMTTHELDSVATFYNLINRRPVGRHVIRLCSSVSCWVMGYEQIRAELKMRLGVDFGETTADGRFTLLPNQCLGACDRAPVLMIDRDTHRDLNAAGLDAVLERYT
jgi:NADH-quinone oxidoreductase subunit E